MLLMKDHTNSVHEKSIKHECDYEGCTKFFWRKKSLMEHRRAVHKFNGGKSKVICTMCDPPQEFYNYDGRSRHYFIVHNLTDYQFSIGEMDRAKNVGEANMSIGGIRKNRAEYDRVINTVA